MIIGVVGKANVGKSTFFKAATLAEVEIANYPFTTIEKNEAIGFVSIECVDKEFNIQCSPRFGYCIHGKRFIPIEMIDVAGLVPGAHKGRGRGNQFLDDLRQADILIHVIDISGSTNENGEPVNPGSYNPATDIKFLEEELDMWYYGILRKGWEKFVSKTKHEKEEIHKALAKQLSGLKVDEDIVKNSIKSLNLSEDFEKWSEDELKKLASELRKKTKPMIIAANKIDLKEGRENYEKLKSEFPDLIIVPCSAEAELALKEAAKKKLIDYIPGDSKFKIINSNELNEKQKNALDFIQKKVLDKFGETGIQEVLNKAVFDLLDHIVVYPVATNKLTDKNGNILPDCFLVPKETTALGFAFKIHGDIGESFIKAVDLKTKQVIGKEHKLKNKDIIEIICSK
jgi:ribosome-binding ATPase YchF (GTP1/OBG family)